MLTTGYFTYHSHHQHQHHQPTVIHCRTFANVLYVRAVTLHRSAHTNSLISFSYLVLHLLDFYRFLAVILLLDMSVYFLYSCPSPFYVPNLN